MFTFHVGVFFMLVLCLHFTWDTADLKTKKIFQNMRHPLRVIKTCSVCLEKERPIKLKCRHTLCMSCCAEMVLIKNNYMFKCPLCSEYLA